MSRRDLCHNRTPETSQMTHLFVKSPTAARTNDVASSSESDPIINICSIVRATSGTDFVVFNWTNMRKMAHLKISVGSSESVLTKR